MFKCQEENCFVSISMTCISFIEQHKQYTEQHNNTQNNTNNSQNNTTIHRTTQTMHGTAQQYTEQHKQHNNTHNSTTIHRTTQQYTEQYNNTQNNTNNTQNSTISALQWSVDDYIRYAVHSMWLVWWLESFYSTSSLYHNCRFSLRRMWIFTKFRRSGGVAMFHADGQTQGS